MRHITHIIAVSIALVVAGCATQKNSQASSAKSGAYIVQSGDTLYKIAKQHQLTIEQLNALNPDMPARLKIGEELVVVAPASK
jgi:LysM repeat protein